VWNWGYTIQAHNGGRTGGADAGDDVDRTLCYFPAVVWGIGGMPAALRTADVAGRTAILQCENCAPWRESLANQWWDLTFFLSGGIPAAQRNGLLFARGIRVSPISRPEIRGHGHIERGAALAPLHILDGGRSLGARILDIVGTWGPSRGAAEMYGSQHLVVTREKKSGTVE